MDKIELKLDETNELLFKVVIEGTTAPASAIRFVCEGDDVAFMFKGSVAEEPGEIRVMVPPMKDRMKEGLYEGRLEVLIEGRYLSPLQCLAQFKPGVKVVAESVQVAPPVRQEIKASAAVVTAKVKSIPVAPAPTLPAPVTEAAKAPSRPKTLAEKFGRTKG